MNNTLEQRDAQPVNESPEAGIITLEEIKAEAIKCAQPAIIPETAKVPPFPVEVFPSAVQYIIKAAEESLNFPADFTSAAILYAVSMAVGNTHRVEVKAEWIENALVYMVNVGKPNTNKSHPLSFILKPIFERDKKAYTAYERDKRVWDECKVKEGPKPFWHKFILSDFTPEALAEVHKFNKRGISVYADELAGWFKNFNRYHKGAEEEFWLSVWSCKPINIDRKGNEPLYIPFPFIPVIGTIQTRILTELSKGNRAQNGFMDRILFAFPDEIQKPYWSESEIHEGYVQNWENIICNLLSLNLNYDETNGNPSPHILKFSPEAYSRLKEWEKQHTNLCRQAEDDALASIYGKFDVHTVRLALLLEMLNRACEEKGQSNEPVRLEAVNGAIKMSEYFKATACKVHDIVTNHNPLDKFPETKRTLYQALPDAFTTAEGIKIAELYDMHERTFKRFLKEKELFCKVKAGEYEKRI